MLVGRPIVPMSSLLLLGRVFASVGSFKEECYAKSLYNKICCKNLTFVCAISYSPVILFY